MFDRRKKVGTRQRYDIQSTGSGPAPVSKSLLKKKEEEGEKKAGAQGRGRESFNKHPSHLGRREKGDGFA